MRGVQVLRALSPRKEAAQAVPWGCPGRAKSGSCSNSREGLSSRVMVAAGRVMVAAGRVMVAAGRVMVAAGRVMVAAMIGPRMDGLAAGGLRFTQFYNTAQCWPSRAALLTGYYAQAVRRDTVPGVPSGNQGRRPKWAKLLPEMLHPLGYRSYNSGKWHIDGMPLANGFDRSYYVEDLGRYFNPRVLFENDQKLPAVKPGSGYYITTAIADHGIKYLKEHAEKQRDQPFFLYLAFNAPHFPLQARPDDIARYHGRYRDGWEAVRAERWKRVQDLGLVTGRLSAVEREVGPPHHFPEALEALGPGEVNRPVPWGTLSDLQRAFQAAKIEIHAAMVDRMDREIGRVVDQLRAMEAFENTLIFFMSDNGASAEITVRDDGHDPAAAAGSAASHLCLGPGWSSVANTPFRRHKSWVHEGGIATPLVVHWPKGVAARGELRHDPGHLIDIVPTILQVAGAPGAARPPQAGPSQHHPERALYRHSPTTAHRGTTTCGGLTKETVLFAWGTGSSSPPRTSRANCTTWQPTAPRLAISRPRIRPGFANYHSAGSATWMSSPRSRETT